MMKKIYSLALILVASAGFAQSVVITTVVDGTLSADGCSASTGGTSSPKIVELYVSGTVNLTNYRVQTESNGATDASTISWNAGTDLTALGTVTNSFVYLVGAGTATFSEIYPSLTPANLTSLPNGNGNDAYRVAIYDGPGATGNLVSVVDQFGDPLNVTASDDYSAPWAYQDSYAKRNHGVAANGGNFVPSTFTYGGVGNFVAPNNTCAFLQSAISLGTWSLATHQNQISGLKVYPNPVSNGMLYIDSDNAVTKEVAIFDVLGKQVIKTSTEQTVNVSSLRTGVYMVKITEAGKTATRKLVIK